MKFEVSEQIRTCQDRRAVLKTLEVQLKKISTVRVEGDVITARAIENTFGSINRYSGAVVTVQQGETGVLCIADVTYRPSVMFWIFFVLGLFAYGLLFWIPIVFYLTQRKTVRSAIVDVFARVKNEFEIGHALAVNGGSRSSNIATVGYCNSCGSILPGGAGFCGGCGAATLPRQQHAIASPPDIMVGKPPIGAARRSGSSIDDLERLAALRQNGLLSDAEFEAAKRRLLGSP